MGKVGQRAQAVVKAPEVSALKVVRKAADLKAGQKVVVLKAGQKVAGLKVDQKVAAQKEAPRVVVVPAWQQGWVRYSPLAAQRDSPRWTKMLMAAST